MKKPTFRFEASFDDATGEPVAFYMRVREGDVDKTTEVKEGVAFANYDKQGCLLGVELLGPCDVAVLDNISELEPEAVRQCLRGSAPRNLVPA
jgi:hypothetical protein